ncbi:MAG: hypothetical protein ACXVPD_14580, partial [Bacteroidia bacterium]
IFAGAYALTGYFIAMRHIAGSSLSIRQVVYGRGGDWMAEFGFYVADAFMVLLFSLLTAYYFSSRKAKKNNAKLFDHTAWRLFWQMAVPLMAGGILSFVLMLHGSLAFIAPVMLCFYGSALFSASKLTYDDVKYLGLAEIALGIVSAIDLGNGLFYWALGFGALHIIYGAVMWWKYERS